MTAMHSSLMYSCTNRLNEIKTYSYTFPYRYQCPFTLEVKDFYFIFPRFVNTAINSISKVATFPR
jgi:hypothetical protein